MLQSLREETELFEEEDEVLALEVVEFVVGDLLEERLQELLVFLCNNKHHTHHRNAHSQLKLNC